MRLKVLFKSLKKETPTYLQNIIPEKSENQHYSLRDSTNIKLAPCRTSAFEHSFIPQSVKDWNQLEDSTKLSGNTENFMTALNEHLTKPPLWYLEGDRNTNILHARLCMLCSPLNDHLFSFIHVIDDPSCSCGCPRENNKHYLLECQLYRVERDHMFQELRKLDFKPLLNNLLYGDSGVSDETNKKAFIVIQNYISSTKRF